MWKKLALVCVLAAGCKNASVDDPKKDEATATETGGAEAKGRSGKIDLGARRARPATGGDTAAPTTGGEGGDPAATAKDQFEDRRRSRIAQFDTDGDGKISPEERKQARHKRADEMRKQADADGNGKVTPDEIAKSNFKRLDPESLDTNKDGDISADEIEAALESRNKAWGGGRFRPDGRFGRLSRDKLGSGAAPQTPAPVQP